MRKAIVAATFVAAVSVAGFAFAQGMLLDYAADKVITKFRTSNCEQLKQHKDEPQTEQQKLAIEFLRNDAQARQAFIDKIAAPVMNKMFECGLIP